MRRPGITLMEVLAAIFITGIGLLSLLTLFPLGALSMWRAIDDDRTALAGDNGRAIANAVTYVDPNGVVRVGLRSDRFVQAAMLQGNWTNAASPDGPGYLVLVDPIGSVAYTGQGNWPNWVGGGSPTSAIPSNVQRIVPEWLKSDPTDYTTNQAILRWCTVQDDIGFYSDGPNQGLAASPPLLVQPGRQAGSVQRNLRYSYAWLCRMPRAGAPNVVDVSTLVFSGGRSLDLVGFGNEEGVYSAFFNTPGANQITINLSAGQNNPDLRPGNWILDASMAPAGGPPTQLAGYFYRIVNVSNDPVSGQMTLEVQTPLRGPWGTSTNPVSGTGTLIVFDNLLEVFEDGTF